MYVPPPVGYPQVSPPASLQYVSDPSATAVVSEQSKGAKQQGGTSNFSLRKQLHFATSALVFPGNDVLRMERRNPSLKAPHYPDLGSASDWLKQISRAARPIRSNNPDLVGTLSALASQTSFRAETSGGAPK